MALEIWIAFVVTSIALLVVPGPTVILVVSYAISHGKRTSWATVPGVALGDLTAMTASLLGAGAILAASATLFTVLKLAGAAYLIWLGIQLWRATPKLDELRNLQSASNSAMFRSAYIVTALNPKSIVFFVAFVPQFMDANSPLLPQVVILESTFVILAAASAALWAIAAGQMRAWFTRPDTLRIANRTGGGFLVGAGLLTAATRS